MSIDTMIHSDEADVTSPVRHNTWINDWFFDIFLSFDEFILMNYL